MIYIAFNIFINGLRRFGDSETLRETCLLKREQKINSRRFEIIRIGRVVWCMWHWFKYIKK